MEPKWKKAERFERVTTFNLRGSARDVFPLLCPVREYEWLSGWSCVMLYSESGVAEEDAMFITKEMFGRKVVWTTITYQPHRFIEYLLVMGQDAVVRLSIGLEETAGETRVRWRMLFTAVSPLAKKVFPKHYSEERFRAMVRSREADLGRYLAIRSRSRCSGSPTVGQEKPVLQGGGPGSSRLMK